MDTLNTFIAENNWIEAAKIVKSMRDTVCVETASKAMEELLEHVKSDYLSRAGKPEVFLTELFRYLRNNTIKHNNKSIIKNDPHFLSEVKMFLKKLSGQLSRRTLLNVICQFLTNYVVVDPSNCTDISNILYEDIVDCLYKGKDNNGVLALLYNIHLRNKSLSPTVTFYEHVLDELTKEECEYGEFLSEMFLYDVNFWNFYDQLEISGRILALSMLKTRGLEGELETLPQIALQVISKKFWTSDKIIFETVSSSETSMEPYEVSLLLDILGHLSGHDVYLKPLQTDKDLIINCGVLLINIHRLGKQSPNYFSSIPKLQRCGELSEVMEKHPTYGFKVGLVRLIGNLTWKNKKMQDLVREAEVIPVLLDCCNIDARNPLIMQWVILAMRNLCEDNTENQAIIAGLHKEGTVSSRVVEEMGLTLQDDENGGIRIVPLATRE